MGRGNNDSIVPVIVTTQDSSVPVTVTTHDSSVPVAVTKHTSLFPQDMIQDLFRSHSNTIHKLRGVT